MRKGVIIIGEAGVNHNGDIKLAKQLIDVASEAGVNYVKFQTFNSEKLVKPGSKKAEYQSRNMDDSSTSQLDMLKKLELSHQDHLELINYCKEKGINFFSTAFDLDGLEYLHSLGFEFFKIPSGELTNYPYLLKLASFGKPVILSTGMATIDEINDSIEVLKTGIDLENITVLHCNTEYPTSMKDVNLNAMLTIKNKFNVSVGYSDHTLGIEVPIAATALGAVVIEKHFTISRNLPGPDHKASLEPFELVEMVRAIRNVELALSNDGQKIPSESEMKNIFIARKSIYFNRNLKAGETITDEDLICLRPGFGISPMEWPKLIGKRVKRNVNVHEVVKWADIK